MTTVKGTYTWLYREIDTLPVVTIDDFNELVFYKKEDAVAVSQLPEILKAACDVVNSEQDDMDYHGLTEMIPGTLALKKHY